MAAKPPEMHQAAEARLAESCPLMRRLIRQIGPCTLAPEHKRQPFESLVRAIAHQQLHARAAEAILARLVNLYPRKFPTAADILATEEAAIRACGFSLAKIAALRDIAIHAENGVIPTRAAIARLSDEEIIARLTRIRGVGQWTVEMLLIFQLGRPDILPADDFGIRNGFRVVKKLEALPRPRDVLEYGTRWKPHSTVASWYLWRAADQSKSKQPRA